MYHIPKVLHILYREVIRKIDKNLLNLEGRVPQTAKSVKTLQ